MVPKTLYAYGTTLEVGIRLVQHERRLSMRWSALFTTMALVPEFVVLGGLVPELLCASSEFQHAGTTDKKKF